MSRRDFLKLTGFGAAGTAFYAGEIDRHWLEVTHHDLRLPGLSTSFDGYRIVQLSDIHMEEFTEPFFVREAVHRINQLDADAVFLTGDFVTREWGSQEYAEETAWKCAGILSELECANRYAIFGNHDVMAGEDHIGEALTHNGIKVLHNSHAPLERGSGRLWIAGIDDPVLGNPDPEKAIPALIQKQKDEPVILLCHAPDFINSLKAHPLSERINLVLSGHTHGGQVRLPFLPPIHLPPLGHQYIEGWFQVGQMQLYVNRGLGTVGVPFRLNCAPEISCFTLRA